MENQGLDAQGKIARGKSITQPQLQETITIIIVIAMAAIVVMRKSEKT